MKNWLPELQKHQEEFLLILARHRKITFEKGDTFDGLYDYLTAGDRHERFTVYDFYLVEELPSGQKIFRFDEGDFGFLSGCGSHANYILSYESGQPKIERIDVLSVSMS